MNYPGLGGGEVVVDRYDSAAKRPHAGKRFACIQAHSDDIPLSCAGLKRAHKTNDCCPANGTLKNTTIYIRI